jgi:hypothetical protein
MEPIIPDDSLFNEWVNDPDSKKNYARGHKKAYSRDLVNKASRYGSEEMLRKVTNYIMANEWFADPSSRINALLTALSPDPTPEDALEALERIEANAVSNMRAYQIHNGLMRDVELIRKTLNKLPS